MSHGAEKRCPYCKRILAEYERYCNFCELELPEEDEDNEDGH